MKPLQLYRKLEVIFARQVHACFWKTVLASLFNKVAFTMCTKDLHAPVRKIKPFCRTDWFLATGSNVLYPWCTTVWLSTTCRVACVIGNGCVKASVVRRMISFLQVVYRMAPKIGSTWAVGNRGSSLCFWFWVSKAWAQLSYVSKSYIMCFWIFYTFHLKASGLFWHPFF